MMFVTNTYQLQRVNPRRTYYNYREASYSVPGSVVAPCTKDSLQATMQEGIVGKLMAIPADGTGYGGAAGENVYGALSFEDSNGNSHSGGNAGEPERYYAVFDGVSLTSYTSKLPVMFYVIFTQVYYSNGVWLGNMRPMAIYTNRNGGLFSMQCRTQNLIVPITPTSWEQTESRYLITG